MSVHLQACPISTFADKFPSGFFSEWGIWTLVGRWTPLVGYFLDLVTTYVVLVK